VAVERKPCRGTPFFHTGRWKLLFYLPAC